MFTNKNIIEREWKEGQWWRWRTKEEMLSYDGMFRISLLLLVCYLLYYVCIITPSYVPK